LANKKKTSFYRVGKSAEWLWILGRLVIYEDKAVGKGFESLLRATDDTRPAQNRRELLTTGGTPDAGSANPNGDAAGCPV
jgi:hypothetical protein